MKKKFVFGIKTLQLKHNFLAWKIFIFLNFSALKGCFEQHKNKVKQRNNVNPNTSLVWQPLLKFIGMITASLTVVTFENKKKSRVYKINKKLTFVLQVYASVFDQRDASRKQHVFLG